MELRALRAAPSVPLHHLVALLLEELAVVGRRQVEGVAGDPQGRISQVSVTLVTPDPAGDIQNKFQR